MNRKILFFDLDGTLWDREEHIPDSTREALRLARRNGHLVFVNTGRSRVFALRQALYGLDFDGMITGCGTRIEWRGPQREKLSFREGEFDLLYDRRLEEESLCRTVDRLHAEGFRLLLEGPEYMYADMEQFRDDPYMQRLSRRSPETLRDLAAWRGRWRASKMTCDMAKAPDRDAALAEAAKRWNVFIHSRDVCELVPRGHDKGRGILLLCRELGWDAADTMAFGDGENDVDMLRTAGVGVAMGDGAAAAIRAADHVTASLAGHGVRAALERFGLLG